jgi:hypothetical protein
MNVVWHGGNDVKIVHGPGGGGGGMVFIIRYSNLIVYFGQ